jgi:hypothetical protein
MYCQIDLQDVMSDLHRCISQGRELGDTHTTLDKAADSQHNLIGSERVVGDDDRAEQSRTGAGFAILDRAPMGSWACQHST